MKSSWWVVRDHLIKQRSETVPQSMQRAEGLIFFAQISGTNTAFLWILDISKADQLRSLYTYVTMAPKLL
jgi:hypothetical protein